MANPTLISGSQKHVPLRGPYRTNTLVELSARIIGSSARLRGFSFVSDTAATVTLGPGDFISIGAILDASKPGREAGIVVRTTANTVVDITGFTDPSVFGFATNTDEGTDVEFLVTEAAPSPTTEYAPIIFRSGGTWYQNRAIGNDELSNSGVLASGTGTVPSGAVNDVTIVHNLNLVSYKVFLQPINQDVPLVDQTGLSAGPSSGVLSPVNQALNTFDVRSSGTDPVDFNWMVIA
jgi:hypothetical protein